MIQAEVYFVVCDLGNGLAYYASSEHRYEGELVDCGSMSPLEASQDVGTALPFESRVSAVIYAWQMGLREWAERQRYGHSAHFKTWILSEEEDA